MPYTGPDDKALPEYVKKVSAKRRAQWVAIFNSVMERCLQEKNNSIECESAAFAQANGVVIKQDHAESVIPPTKSAPAAAAKPAPDISQDANEPIAIGDIISWGQPEEFGKVISFHQGQVPGIDDVVIGTRRDPGLKVQIIKMARGKLSETPILTGKLLSTVDKPGLVNVKATETESDKVLSAGSFVHFSHNGKPKYGKIASVHTGKVPKVRNSVTGTKTKPAARVHEYLPKERGWVGSGIFWGTHLEDIDKPGEEEKELPGEAEDETPGGAMVPAAAAERKLPPVPKDDESGEDPNEESQETPEEEEDEIDSGDMVTWSANGKPVYGKIVAIYTNGKVPKVAESVTGSAEEPAARVQVYVPNGEDWKSTPRFVGALVSALRKLDDTDDESAEKDANEPRIAAVVDDESKEDPNEESRETPEEEDEEIEEGDFVGWDTDDDDDIDGIGRVVTIVTNGPVPDVQNRTDGVSGTVEDPAARVQLFKVNQAASSLEESDTYLAIYVEDLEKLDQDEEEGDEEEFSSPDISSVYFPVVMWNKSGKTQKLTVDKKFGKKKTSEAPVPLSRAFLTRLRDILKGKVAQPEFDTAVKTARAHAGGKAKAAKATKKQAEDVTPEMSAAVEFAEGQVSDKPWGEVDKTALRNNLLTKLNEGQKGAAQAVRETYAVIKSDNLKDSPSTNWALPHHELNGNKLVLNRGGVEAAYNAMKGGRGGVDLTPEQHQKAARHLLKSYHEMGGPVPIDLTKMAAGESTELYSHDFEYGLFMEVRDFAEAAQTDDGAPEWIPILPQPHEYKHPSYGDIKITRARNEQFINNFQKGVYQDELPLDAEHETKLSGAYAWMTDMRMNQDGSVDAKVRWTPRGKELVKKGGFRYVSPEWYDKWEDPGTGKVINDVLVGGALTKRPFFKAPYLRPLVANEQGLLVTVAGETFTDTQRTAENDDLIVEPQGDVDMGITQEQFDALQNTVAALSAKLESANKTIETFQQKEAALTAAEQKFGEMNTTLAQVQGVISTLESERDAAKAASESLAATVTEQVKTVEELKVAKEAAEKFSESQAKLLEEATSHIQSMKASERRQRFSDEVLGRGENKVAWYGDKDANIALLEKMADTFGETDESFQMFVTNQRAMAAQANQSDLFREVGSSREVTPSNSAAGRLEDEVRKYMSETGKGEDEAYAHIALTNNRLYSEYTEELRTRK